MAEIVRFAAGEGASVLVEADEDAFGVERVGRGADGTIQANERLDRALASARATIASALAALGGLGFEELVLEFGIKLTAETGAVIAKTAAEGHLTVTAKWGAQAEQQAPKPPEVG